MLLKCGLRILKCILHSRACTLLEVELLEEVQFGGRLITLRSRTAFQLGNIQDHRVVAIDIA